MERIGREKLLSLFTSELVELPEGRKFITFHFAPKEGEKGTGEGSFSITFEVSESEAVLRSYIAE